MYFRGTRQQQRISGRMTNMLHQINLWIHFPNAKSLTFAFSYLAPKNLILNLFRGITFFPPTKCITKRLSKCEKESHFLPVYLKNKIKMNLESCQLQAGLSHHSKMYSYFAFQIQGSTSDFSSFTF